MKIIKSNVSSPDACIAIVVARFNHFVNENLLNGAIDTLIRIGQVKEDNITVIWVPGAYELPLVVKILSQKEQYDAIVALGTVIRGETPHFNFISSECSRGLATISLERNLPIAFGILTTENIEQAIDRAGVKSGNKGAEAALTVLEMINLLQRIKS
ncbi:6,7-dimethyl-8-ribityllumazine synthase [Candidatus Schneideria nysicola]|uniref:6,7-dimethyl-8-ribityllumazine synthase n=1 Tax=Candidatus Schneideria nysicola TaxID=1081631 RepID=UPI001CAA6835|nr:6,7-dimethyl-8-ribityllumazine synthase [Candidatus Schneideria nysicola]UAJ65206.1 6,7-dimethyl-8-ribityllumazine synthase [Candidatus Schneideria nysicola]